MYGKKLLFMMMVAASLAGCASPTVCIEKEELTGLPRCYVKNNKLEVIQNARAGELSLEKKKSAQGVGLNVKGQLRITQEDNHYHFKDNPEIEFLIDGYTFPVKVQTARNHNYIDENTNRLFVNTKYYTDTNYQFFIDQNIIEKIIKAKKVLVRVKGGYQRLSESVLFQLKPESLKVISSFYEECLLKDPQLTKGDQ